MADENTKLPELSENSKKVLEIVEKMTVLELADLVKVMEDKFGVSAAAPVADSGRARGTSVMQPVSVVPCAFPGFLGENNHRWPPRPPTSRSTLQN